MLKQNWRVISYIARVTDNLIILSSFYFAYYFRDGFVSILDSISLYAPYLFESVTGGSNIIEAHTELGPISDYFVILLIGFPLYNFFLSSMGGYRSMRFRSAFSFLKLSAAVSGAVFLCSSALLFVLNLDLSRSFLTTFCLLVFVSLFFERLVVLWLLRFFRIRGKNFRNLLIVGTGEQARNLYQEVVESPELGIRVQGFVDISNNTDNSVSTGPVSAVAMNSLELNPRAEKVEQTEQLVGAVIATEETFEESLKKYAIDEVLFTDTERYYNRVQSLARIAVDEGITVSFAAVMFGFDLSNSAISHFGSTPLVHYESTPSSIIPLAIKRTMDLAISSTCLVVIAPALILLGLVIKLDSKGPVYFRQKRVGLNGRIFTLLKFRSMYADAEKNLSGLLAKNEMTGPVFKITQDPRVTRVGRFIRKYSIDELPQLINVLKGDMSLVGPRPPLPSEVERYARRHRRRLSMRPGITCTWQVSGRNEIPCFEEWTELDLAYIDQWSLKKDLSLLVKTIPAVLSGKGAA